MTDYEKSQTYYTEASDPAIDALCYPRKCFGKSAWNPASEAECGKGDNDVCDDGFEDFNSHD
jgi:hypothetical protein